jgi:hypothetical protein
VSVLKYKPCHVSLPLEYMRLIKKSDHIRLKYLSQVALDLRRMWLTERLKVCSYKDP